VLYGLLLPLLAVLMCKWPEDDVLEPKRAPKEEPVGGVLVKGLNAAC